MQFAIFLLVLCVFPHLGFAQERDRDATDIRFYNRLHETFLLLNQVVIPAYLEHFSGEPDKLSVVQYYAERLAEAGKGEALRTRAPAILPNDEASAQATPPVVWMRAALAEASSGNKDILEHHLGVLSAQPHAVLHRTAAQGDSTNTARCPLYDPELLLLHRRLWELKTGGTAPTLPPRVADALAQRQEAVRTLRDQPDERELSLRKFLDKHRQLVWEVGWLYRCRGIELENDAAVARECFLRAWAIGEALFPVSDRGRLEKFDRVFLAELGDVYARLGRYDLMLRYMYSDQGLPARFEMARPVAALARVAESVRLARHDESAVEQLDEVLPETVSQILFETAVLEQPLNRDGSGAKNDASMLGHINVGWLLIGIGAVVLLVAVTLQIRRIKQARNV